MGTRFDRWEKRHKKWLKTARFDIRLVAFISLLLFALVATTIFGYKSKHSGDDVRLGVSFSVKYAQELGNDWKKNFLALTDELEVPHMRLMSYWDTIEQENNQYNFDDLDWQMEVAESNNVTVTLAVGQRQPRWPECHVPGWASEMPTKQYRAELLEFISAVVTRYRDNPALETYQLENEAANNLFGHCPEFDPDFLDRELAMIKRLDKDTPVVINTSNQSGVPVKSGVGDQTGFSIYRHAHFEAFGRQWKWNYKYLPSWWHTLRAAFIEGFHGNETFIHELQTEPWGTVPTVYMSDEDQLALMNPAEIQNSINYGLSTGMKKADLWGGEWWYYRKTQKQDREFWHEVRDIFKSYNQ